ncbi:MAG: DNA repair protein RecO [Candidatus Margulisiibacteriota bacterium]
MATYQTKAISLRTSLFGEADKLVTLFSKDRGKIKLLAKGARRVPSRFGGRVEPLTYAEFLIAQGRNLDIISQCDVLETFQAIRNNPEALPAGLYLLRLVELGTAEGQFYPELFDLLLDALWKLKNGVAAKKMVTDFERAFVEIEGINREGIEPYYLLSEHIGAEIKKW